MLKKPCVFWCVWSLSIALIACDDHSATQEPFTPDLSIGQGNETDGLSPPNVDMDAPNLDLTLASGDTHIPFSADAELHTLDATKPLNQDRGAPMETEPRVRATCFVGEPMDTGIETPPVNCIELFMARPDLESGCYLLNDGAGGLEPSYCWHRRALIFLANNDIESESHPQDTDNDGVIDDGPQRGENFPDDPLGNDLTAVKERFVDEVRDWFSDVSYGALYVDVIDVVTPDVAQGLPDRWFRLQQLRPGFAHPDLFREYCRQQGGMTPDDWVRIDYLVTTISHGTRTSGSQWRMETLPIGEECDGVFPLQHNYNVVKRFQSWDRLGTLFHEIAHGLARDPNPEPSLGHSESIQADTGNQVEYGDRSDVMGNASRRGHFSLAQKMFLRLLPEELVHTMPDNTQEYGAMVHPIERHNRELKGIKVPVENGRTYYVEARADLGNDQRIPSILKAGALVKRANHVSRANKSWLVDCTPETPTENSGDSVLLPHRTFQDRSNRLFISVLAAHPDGVHVVVRRTEPSSADPVVDSVMTQVRVNQLSFVALAHPGDPSVPNEDLLFFWKIGPRDTLHTPTQFVTGRRVQIERPEEDTPIWLLVSDQRGGETWTQVWPENP